MQREQDLIREYINKSTDVQQQLAQEQGEVLAQISKQFIHTLRQGRTIYICGNGGSAADAQHAATELVGRFLHERRALPAVALTTDTSILTAVANDYGFAEVFARQVRALVVKGDLVVGISTSGKSENILRAMAAAKEIGAFTIGFTGKPGEPLVSAVDLCLQAPSSSTPHIQEAHVLCWHLICYLVEREFC